MVGQKKECMETRKCLTCKHTHTVGQLLGGSDLALPHAGCCRGSATLKKLRIWKTWRTIYGLLTTQVYIQGECHTLVSLV